MLIDVEKFANILCCRRVNHGWSCLLKQCAFFTL